MLISDVGADHSKKGSNACVFYFFNVLIDTTFGAYRSSPPGRRTRAYGLSTGVAAIYGLLHLANYTLVDKLQLKGYQSGQYGTPPKFTYWARQAAVYVAVLITMKLLVVGVFALWPGILSIGEWLLKWTGTNEDVQVILYAAFTLFKVRELIPSASVMGFFPIVMNVIQFWIIDSIVKAAAVSTSSNAPSAEAEEEEAPFLSEQTEDEESEPTPRDLEDGLQKPERSPSPDRKANVERPPLSSRSDSSSSSRRRL